jgi:hypothetical protein
MPAVTSPAANASTKSLDHLSEEELADLLAAKLDGR